MRRRCARAAFSLSLRRSTNPALPNKKSINVALLGVLSRHLPFSVEAWTAALKRNLPEKLHEANLLGVFHGAGRGA
jgi:Pyruvate/2-oxoacid:ferredoxin oxidoreductase gamma subunit